MCIVGAGYTGLWTAYYLLRADPSLQVVVLEAEIAGFGASGRNGGWCSALFPTTASALARRHGRAAAIGMRRAMNDTVAEVGRVTAAEGIVCDYVAGGSVRLARTDVQLHRARTEVAADGVFGGVDGVLLLDAEEARSRVGARDVLGATYLPHCARIHPARLARGLARVVERRGALIAERTRALRIEPGRPGGDDVPSARSGLLATGGHRPGSRPGPTSGAGHRGLDDTAAGHAARGDPGLLADRRHRAAARTRSGPAPGWRTVRRSPTTGT